VARRTRSLQDWLPSPTLETLVVIFWVYVLQLGAASVGAGPDLFVLRLPVLTRPWTLFTTVYAHAGPVHLLANAIVLVPAGLFVEQFSTRWGFHGLFFLAGLGAAAAVVIAGTALGIPVSALGASGGVFALVGYAGTGFPTRRAQSNPDGGVRAPQRTPGRGSFLVLGMLLVAVPMFLGTRPLVTLGHATGFAVGLVAGATQWINGPAHRSRSLK
jgi:membrane associated rhomboid family serine protease